LVDGRKLTQKPVSPGHINLSVDLHRGLIFHLRSMCPVANGDPVHFLISIKFFIVFSGLKIYCGPSIIPMYEPWILIGYGYFEHH